MSTALEQIVFWYFIMRNPILNLNFNKTYDLSV
jgi:hypothetical protein